MEEAGNGFDESDFDSEIPEISIKDLLSALELDLLQGTLSNSSYIDAIYQLVVEDNTVYHKMSDEQQRLVRSRSNSIKIINYSKLKKSDLKKTSRNIRQSLPLSDKPFRSANPTLNGQTEYTIETYEEAEKIKDQQLEIIGNDLKKGENISEFFQIFTVHLNRIKEFVNQSQESDLISNLISRLDSINTQLINEAIFLSWKKENRIRSDTRGGHKREAEQFITSLNWPGWDRYAMETEPIIAEIIYESYSIYKALVEARFHGYFNQLSQDYQIPTQYQYRFNEETSKKVNLLLQSLFEVGVSDRILNEILTLMKKDVFRMMISINPPRNNLWIPNFDEDARAEMMRLLSKTNL